MDKQDEQHELSQYKSRGMCHIDGPIAVLKARQQRDPLNKRILKIDKLVRRQALRAVLHRSCGVPRWLEDGAIFGESGFSLELDRRTVNITRIQREAQALSPRPQFFNQERKVPDCSTQRPHRGGD
jgi:hypothetical protein